MTRPAFFSHCPVCNAETPPGAINCPSCNVNLEIARNNAIKDITREAGVFDYLAGQYKKSKPSLKFFVLLVIGFIIFIFLMYSSGTTSLSLPNSTNTPKPTIPPTRTPMQSCGGLYFPCEPVSSNTASTNNNCLHWSTITPQMQGQTVCVYGVVSWHSENVENALTYLYFGGINNFFLVSDYVYAPLDGDCVIAKGTILTNISNVPYIEFGDSISICE